MRVEDVLARDRGPRPDTGALLDLAVAAARSAAESIRLTRPEGRVPVADTKSSATDPVTEIDRATERLIRSVLLAARPDDGFLGEEDEPTLGSSGVRWVVDPIDGTVNFVMGLPSYAVSIGCEVDGTTVAGAVINVATREEFTARLDHGAYLRSADGEVRRLAVPTGVPLSRAVVATGYHYRPEVRARQAASVSRLVREVADVRRVGAASLDLCNVAAGRVDAYVEQGLKEWDRSAGTLVAREAGGHVRGLDGDADERLTIAAGSVDPADLLALVRRCQF